MRRLAAALVIALVLAGCKGWPPECPSAVVAPCVPPPPLPTPAP